MSAAWGRRGVRGVQGEGWSHTLMCVSVCACKGGVEETAEVPDCTQKKTGIRSILWCRVHAHKHACTHAHAHRAFIGPRSNPKYKHRFHSSTYVRTRRPCINMYVMNGSAARRREPLHLSLLFRGWGGRLAREIASSFFVTQSQLRIWLQFYTGV